MALKSEREVLNHLIESCLDGERGFKTAAEHLVDPTLRSLFIQLSAERAPSAQREPTAPGDWHQHHARSRRGRHGTAGPTKPGR